MIVLAIDTATTELVAGIADVEASATVIRAERVVATRSHNELLVPTVQELLEEAGCQFSDLAAIVAGCGPGPFTGLRVGMASASAFGQALDIPVHGVCTHDAVAQLIAADTAGSALVVTDARRREVYWARYENGHRIAGPGVIAPAALAEEIGAGPVDVLSCPENMRDQLEGLAVLAADVRHVAPHTTGLIAAADFNAQPEPLVPLYLRRPDAQEPAPKPTSPAIPAVATDQL